MATHILRPRALLPAAIAFLRGIDEKAASKLARLERMVERSDHRPRDPLPPTPKISCLMVSRNSVAVARRGLQSYLRQVHPNRELLIVRDPRADSDEFVRHVHDVGRPDIRVVIGDGRTLAALRNEALALASGDVVCTWDDDDLSHADRLGHQLQAIQQDGTVGSYLGDHLELLIPSRELFCVDHRRAPAMACHHGTMMLRRDVRAAYSQDPVFAADSEDTAFFFGPSAPVSILQGSPHLFIYCFDNTNTWNEQHRRQILQGSGTRLEHLGELQV
jgi:glycosyltransferase involved in cell wall biosynthesis